MNALVLSNGLPRNIRRGIFWKYVKILFVVVSLFAVYCVTLEKPITDEPSLEAQVIVDVRRVEADIARLFGYENWSLAPTQIAYNTECKDPDSYESHGTIILSCDTLKYRQGKPFKRKNMFGEMESFSGYAEYQDRIVHETAHHFAELFIDLNDSQLKECEPAEYFELSEGFATYVEFEVLLREAKEKKDYQTERYLAAKMVRFAIQLSVLDKKFDRSFISGVVAAMGFSSESKQYIDSEFVRFLEKPHALKDEDVISDWYPLGLVRILAIKHQLTKDGLRNGVVKKSFCL